MNHKTVQSLSHEEDIVKDYQDQLSLQDKQIKNDVFAIGFLYGVSRGSLLITNAIIFLGSAFIIAASGEFSPDLYTA